MKEHPYFHETNWIAFEQVLRTLKKARVHFPQGKIPPPYVPKLKGDGDTSCFDREFTDEAPNITQIKLKANQVKQCETGFPEFSFTAKSF